MPEVWGVVPAAGSGQRMGGGTPKQYLPLAGRTVIEHALAPLVANRRLRGVMVALAAGDRRWPTLPLAADPRLHTCTGGAERCHSVLAALDAVRGLGAPDAWVLVHDAARPCLRAEDVDTLLDAGLGHGAGALLAAPVVDTLKRAGASGEVEATVGRERLWRALTPQLFPLRTLHRALSAALAAGRLVTDEAQAMEWAGHRPLLVRGHGDNIKVTTPDDHEMAAFILGGRRRAACA